MSLVETANTSCPYCGEIITISVDISAGSQNYIEDCQVCCQPIELRIEIDSTSAMTSISTSRQDD